MASIVISILTNSRQAQRDLNATATTAQKIGDKFRQAAAPAAGTLAGIAAIGKVTVDAASAAEQSLGGTQAIFKDYANTVIRTSQEAADKYGLSANQYRESANLIGALLKNQGVAMEDLGGQTEQLVSRAADLSSMFGGTTAEAVEALSAAFKGEFDSLDKYGVNLSATKIAAELAAKGQDKLTGAAADAAKQQATMRLIMEQSADAAGNFARESETLGGQQQRAAAEIENVKAQLGTALLPVMVRAAQIVSQLTTFVSQNSTQVKIAVAVIGSLAVAVLAVNAAMTTYSAVTTAATGITKALNFAFAASPIGFTVIAIGTLIAALVILYKKSEAVRNIIDSVGRFIAKIPERVGFAVEAIGALLSGLYDTVTNALSNAGTWLLDAGKQVIQGLIDGITSKVTDLLGTMGSIAGDVINTAKGVFEIFSPSRAFRRIGQFLTQGLAQGILGGLDRANKAIERISRRLSKSAMRELKSQFDQYRDLARYQDRLTASLTKAQEKLKSLRDTARGYANNIRDSIVNFGSVLNLGEGDGFGSFDQLVSQLRDRASEADAFRAVIAKLRKQGLNQTTIDQLLAAGPESIGTAQTILDGGAGGIAQINRLTKRLQRTGQAMGNAAAESLYGAGLEAAQGVVDGFKKKQRELDRIANRFARILRQAVLEGLEATAAQEAAREQRKKEREARRALREAKQEARSDGKITDAERERIRELAKEYAKAQGPMRVDLTSEQVDQLTRGRRIRADLNAWDSTGGRQKS